MPRLSDKKKQEILADFHTGKYSQRELQKKHGVSIGTINKMTKDIEPQNEHLVNAQKTVLLAKKELPNEQMNAVMSKAIEEAEHEALIKGNAVKLAHKLNTMTDQIDTPNDALTLANANDRLGLTLGIIPRHAPKIDVTQLQQQTASSDTTVQIIEDKVGND